MPASSTRCGAHQRTRTGLHDPITTAVKLTVIASVLDSQDPAAEARNFFIAPCPAQLREFGDHLPSYMYWASPASANSSPGPLTRRPRPSSPKRDRPVTATAAGLSRSRCLESVYARAAFPSVLAERKLRNRREHERPACVPILVICGKSRWLWDLHWPSRTDLA